MDTISIIKVLEELNYTPCIIRGSVDSQSDYESNVFYQKDGNEILVSNEVPYSDFLEQYSLSDAKVKSDELRLQRNKKLQETDWTQLPDVPESTRNKWQTYRQELRDITNTFISIQGVVWPTKPE